MKSEFIPTRRGRFHCLKWGEGPHRLLAFHGFGLRADRFDEVARQLPDDFTFYAIDLPFHGLTQWSFPEFTPDDLVELVSEIHLQEPDIPIWGLGHSLGGRLWLHLFPELATHLKGLLLIAPDGLRTRGLGLAMSLPLNLRQSIARSMQQPDVWLQLAGWANQNRMMRPGQYRFVKKHLEDRHKRECLIRTWLSMRRFAIDEKRICRTCRDYQLPIQVLLGKKDPLIPEKVLRRRLRQWPRTEITYTEEGHMPRAETVTAWIRQKITE